MEYEQVVGSTNKLLGKHPHNRPHTLGNSLQASGIDENVTINDFSGRPQIMLPFVRPTPKLT